MDAYFKRKSLNYEGKEQERKTTEKTTKQP